MSADGPRIAQVSEVLDRLVGEFGSDPAQRPILFQAALRVCGDESRRATRGRPCASLDDLVERARAHLQTPQGKANLEAARSSKATPVYVAPAGTPATPPLERPPVQPPQQPAASSGPPYMPPPERLSAGPTAPPAGVPVGEPVGLPGPSLLRPSDTGAFRSESWSVAENIEAARRPEGVHRRPRPPLVVGLIGLVALAALAYVGLRWFGAAGRSGTQGAAQSARASGASAAPRRAAAAQGVPATTAVQQPAPATSPTGALTPTNAAVQGATAAAVTPAQRPPAGYAETMVSPTWAGHAPTYVVHFSSFRERANADRDAARIAKEYGRPAYAAEVTIPERGLYYRVILGDFATAAEARAFRADLVAANTPGVGAVYWVVGP
jgi:hypothetical protein